MHYKSPDNQLHYLDDDSFVHLLPEGSAAITDEEAEAIREANKPAPSPVTSITMRQARLALLHQNLLDDVEALLAAMPGDEGKAARIEWEYSSAVERNRPYVLTLATALGLSSQDLDDLFTFASTL